MASSNRIRCINKSDRTNPHERIKSIGGLNDDGGRWKLTEAEAIAGIEANKWSFYVLGPRNETVAVMVANHLGRKYLKTVADGIRPDNLLALPECP
jgi:hypothetical protein